MIEIRWKSKMRIIVTGATGLIGKKICAELISKGEDVVVFSRSARRAESVIPNAADYIEWNYEDNNDSRWKEEINNADAIIHLAGENVMARRWNEEHKQRVLNSRVNGTKSLVDAVNKNSKLKSFISASAVGYYGNSETKVFSEDSEHGHDFLATVTKRWENEVIKVSEKEVREARIRIGIVLDKSDGALAKMLPPFKMFIGGPLGSGNQWFPWIHADDVVGIFLHALYNKEITGPLNAVAPGIVNMKQFSKSLGKVLNRPSLFSVPEFALKVVLGEGAEVVTKGANVKPQLTFKSEYKFLFENEIQALNEIFKQ
jgi:uncharacterized protein (TIGR01777 family)